MRVEREVEIARPPEEVFDFVADARNDPRWCSRVELCEQVAGDGPGLGARYRARHRPTRLKPAAELSIEVVGFEPGRRIDWRQEDDDGVFKVTYVVEPAEGGTRFTQRDEIEWKLPRPLQLIAGRLLPRHIEEQMAALKGLLEPS